MTFVDLRMNMVTKGVYRSQIISKRYAKEMGFVRVLTEDFTFNSIDMIDTIE